MQPLVFVLVVLLVMVGTIIWLSNIGSKERDPVPVGKVTGEQPEVSISSQTVPWDPKTETWGEVNDLERSGQRGIPTLALKKAVELAGERSWHSFRSVPTTLDPNWVGFRRMEIPRLFEATSILRGQPFAVVGTLVSLEPVDVFDAYDRMKLHGGGVKSYEGVVRPDPRVHGSQVPVKFLMVDEMDSPTFLPGDPVKLQGVFFKLQEIQIDGEAVVGPWLLGKGLHRSFRIPDPDELDMSVLASVADDRVVQTRRHVLEDSQLFHLLGDVLHRPDRDRGAGIEMTGQPIQDLITSPQEFRGKKISLQARVLKIEEIPLNAFFPENAEGDHALDTLWVTYLTTDAKVPLTVAWTKKPDIDLALSEQIRIDAVFYRLWGYRAQKSWLRAPFLVGLGDIERVDVNEGAGMSRSIAIGIVSFSVLALVLIVVALRVDRRKAELFAERRTARKKVRRGSLDLNDVARRSGGDS
jgi:hypothetical protein